MCNLLSNERPQELHPKSAITKRLNEVRAGKEGAFEELVEELYDDLRRMASRHLDQNAVNRTLSPTGLVHEAYLRFADQTSLSWKDRSHFYSACSRVMRNIVIDFARRRKAAKRGGNRVRITLDENEILIDAQADDLLAVDEALNRLPEYGPRLGRVVECRFFAGLTEPETAEVLGVSERTIRRDWIKARTLLRQLMSDSPPGASA